MALKQDKIDLIIALVKKGGLSNVQISKKVGCSESAVRTTIKKNAVERNEITNLAKDEVQSIIIQNEIQKRKNELNSVEKTIYDAVLLTEVQSKNLALNANHLLLQEIHKDLLRGTKETKVNSGDGVQTIEPIQFEPSDRVHQAKAIQTVTDSLGITDRHAPKTVIENTNAQQTNEAPTIVFQRITKNADS